MAYIAAVFIAAVVATYMASFYVRYKLRMLRRYREYASSFFAHAEILMASKHTPSEVRASIAFLAERIDSRISAYALWRALQLSPKDLAPEVLQYMAERSVAIDEFEHKYPSLAERFDKAMASGVLAVSYTNGYYGRKIRDHFAPTIKRHNNFGTTIVMDAQAASSKTSHTPKELVHAC